MKKATAKMSAAKKAAAEKSPIKNVAAKKVAGKKAAMLSPFDRLRRDKNEGGYSTKLKHGARTIEVRFETEEEDELRSLIPSAQMFWKSREKWFKTFREYCATELLSLLNDNLDSGDEDFQEVSAAQVRRLLPVPFSVLFTCQYDDSGEVYFQMNGGEDEKTLEENCFSVWGTLKDGIATGDVESLL